MTSKRNIEKRIGALEDDRQANSGRLLADVYPEDVTRTIQAAYRDLWRETIIQKSDAVVNAPEPDATEHFLMLVRERHGIDEDHDNDVRRALEDLVADSWQHAPYDIFADAMLSFATECDIETAGGETLTDLVRAGREDEMADLLVGEVYEAFAGRGGRRMEVPA